MVEPRPGDVPATAPGVLGANVFWPDHNEQMNNGGLVYGQDFGVGAGFYLNATQDKWKAWRMYDYITKVTPGG